MALRYPPIPRDDARFDVAFEQCRPEGIGSAHRIAAVCLYNCDRSATPPNPLK
jgi:hypothetical protein